MATVSEGWRASITWQDSRGKRGTTLLEMDVADYDEASTALPNVVAAYLALTDCVLVAQHTYEEFVNDAAAYAGSGVLLSTKALMEFEIADKPNKSATLTVPSPKQAIFVATSGPNSTIVDLENAAVVTWRSLFQAAGPLFLSDGEKAEILRKGQKITRGSSGS